MNKQPESTPKKSPQEIERSKSPGLKVTPPVQTTEGWKRSVLKSKKGHKKEDE